MESVSSLMTKMKNCKKVAVVGNGGIATELVYTMKGVKVILHSKTFL
jgi:acetaldehyde dehydrogenase (acetylating)